MRALTLLVLLAAGVVFAQPNITRGGFLKKKQYQTYGNMTLYVDPTGSDNGACMTTGTGACATIGGALGKIPKNIRHTVTVNIAAGTYSESVQVTGFAVSRPPNDTSASAALTISGTQGAPTLASGATTGTLTSASTAAYPVTVTDSGQSWTVDDLKGRFLLMTSGARNGFYYPIVSNTATVLTLAAPDSGLVSGATYSIVEPKTVLTGSIRMQGNGGGGTVTLESIKSTSSLPFTTSTGNTTAITVQQSQFVTTGSVSMPNSSLSTTLTRSYVSSSSVSACGVIFNATTGGSAAVSMTYAKGTFAACLNGGTLFTLTGFFEGSTAGFYLSAGSLSGLQATAAYKCSTPGSGTGLLARTPTNLIGPLGSFYALNTYVQDCGIGVGSQFPGLTIALTSSVLFTNVTTAVSVAQGGRVFFNSATPTFTGVTNELSLDGTVYPFSFLTGLPSPQVISNSYGSTIIR